MKQKILIHSLVFSPDGVSTAYLYNDIAIGFQKAGYDVVVLTTTPHYNIIAEDLAKQPFRNHLFGLYSTSTFHGIKVYHVYQRKYKHFLLRVLGFIFWHCMSFIIGLCQKNISFIISPSPPLTIGFVSIILAKIKRAKVAYNVQEIYPDFLINLGSIKSRFIIKVLQWLERFIYKHSDAVITIDQLFYNTIKARVIDQSKLFVIPNFVDTSLYTQNNNFAEVLDSKLFPKTASLKVMYAGNIGYAQDWEPLLFAAKSLMGLPIEFFIIGEGVLKDSIQQKINEIGLDNVHLLPYQPRSSMSAVLSYADLHFIFMNPDMDAQGFPSKVYTIMACAKPLVVISGNQTPLYNFLQKKECAFLIDSRETQNACVVLTQLLESHYGDKETLARMGANGEKIVKDHYSKEAVMMKYIALVQTLLS